MYAAWDDGVSEQNRAYKLHQGRRTKEAEGTLDAIFLGHTALAEVVGH